VTALPVERGAVIRHLNSVHSVKHKAGNDYMTGQFLSWQVCVSQIAPGNSSAALETERTVQHFNPDIALFVGIAGGVKDVQLGDVVAGTKMYGYESGADREHFQPRPEVFLTSYPLIQEAYVVSVRNRYCISTDSWHANFVLSDLGFSSSHWCHVNVRSDGDW